MKYTDYQRVPNDLTVPLAYSMQSWLRELWETVDYIKFSNKIPPEQNASLLDGIPHIDLVVKTMWMSRLDMYCDNWEHKPNMLPYKIDGDFSSGYILTLGNPESPIATVCNYCRLDDSIRKKIGMMPVDENIRRDLNVEDIIKMLGSKFSVYCMCIASADKGYIQNELNDVGYIAPLDGVDDFIQEIANGLVLTSVSEQEQKMPKEHNLTEARPYGLFDFDLNDPALGQAVAHFMAINNDFDCQYTDDGKLMLGGHEIQKADCRINFDKVYGGREAHKGNGYHLEVSDIKLRFKAEAGYITMESGVNHGATQNENLDKIYEMYLNNDHRFEKAVAIWKHITHNPIPIEATASGGVTFGLWEGYNSETDWIPYEGKDWASAPYYKGEKH